MSCRCTVTTIGEHAFSGWGDLTTLTIPRSVTYIGDWAFAACTSLATVNFYADSCTYMGSTAAPVFDNDIHIQTLHIGNTVKTIPANAFYGCSGIGTVTIPASVFSIGSNAFAGCSGLTSITAKRQVAPVAGANAFDNIPASTPVYIPCGSTASYASRWSHFSNFIEVMDAHVRVASNDAARGTASVVTQPSCATPVATIAATPNAGYHFVQWSDGDTVNPRLVTIDRDTLFTAFFIPTPIPDTVYIHDTTYVPDTTYIYDTTVVHDTTIVDNYIYDTVTVWLPVERHTLTLVSEQPAMGIVVGSGTYSDSTEVEIAAVAVCGHHLVQWSDGSTENPRHVTVVEDMELTATFADDEVGITDVVSTNAIVTVQGSIITVQGAEGQRVRIFDSLGRLLSTEQTLAETQHFRMMATGVYLVQVGDGPAQRVVVRQGR